MTQNLKMIKVNDWFFYMDEALDTNFNISNALKETIEYFAGQYNTDVKFQCLSKKKSKELLDSLLETYQDFPKHYHYDSATDLTQDFNSIDLFNPLYKSVVYTSSDDFEDVLNASIVEAKLTIQKEANQRKIIRDNEDLSILQYAIQNREQEAENKRQSRVKNTIRSYSNLPNGFINKIYN